MARKPAARPRRCEAHRGTARRGSMNAPQLPDPARAAEINSEHRAAFGKAREALEHARRAGELLLQVKAEAGHGEWLPWVEANCKFSERTAQGYMRLASQWDRLQGKSATAADLTLHDALAVLSEKPATAATGVLPEEQRLLDKVRAAGGFSSIDERNRVSRIQRRLMQVALDNLAGAIDEGIAGMSVDDLHHALSCLDDCIKILNGWLPEDLIVGVCAAHFKAEAKIHAEAIRDALRATA